MWATPGSLPVVQGNGTSYNVTVTRLNGFAGNVTLSTSGLPANANGSFTPSSVVKATGSATMNVTTSTSTPAGTYTITITGTGTPGTHSTTVQLVVHPKNPPLEGVRDSGH